MTTNFALVIGGSGMLSGASVWLSENGYEVYVVGRRADKLEQLRGQSKCPETIHGIAVDYEDTERFRGGLSRVLERAGRIPSLVVSWIHGTAPDAQSVLINLLETYDINTPWALIHVQGSARFFQKENTPVPANCLYRRVYLGFIRHGRHSRWLTHDEISSGVIQAIASKQNESVIGTLEPWDMRP
ncbi:short-chain dehydrogenase [Virgibacillus siamensis]|uniref:Short-chain dehydrogenase n=1 Tax=Virgibacillus siamensis TaxID=480071 RepID=A0ABP3RBQ7_9BACI